MIRYALIVCTTVLLAAATSHAQPRPTESVIHDLSAALLAGNSARVLELFDLANGGYAYSFDGTLRSGPKFEAWLRRDILEAGRVFTIDAITARGSDIHVDASYGIGRPESRRFYLFRLSPAGKITEWRISHSPAAR